MKNQKAKKKDNKFLRNFPYMFLSVILGMILGSGIIFYTETQYIHMGDMLGFSILLELIVACYAQIVIHEAGHLVFGLLSGYKFTSFRIGSFIWVRVGERIKFKRYSLMGTGGQCLLNPPDMVDGKFPVKLYNAGGVLMNLISAVLFGLLGFLTLGIPLLSSGFVTMAASGIVLALLNGIPMHASGIDNDGYNMLHLEKSSDAMYSFWLQLRINAESANGKRLKDMPEEWFIVPELEKLNNPLSGAIAVSACERAMDQKDFQKVSSLANFLLNETTGILPIHKSFLVNSAMYCEMIGQNRVEVIELKRDRVYKKFAKAMKMNPAVLRTQYTYELLCIYNEKKAEIILRQFEKVAKTYPYEAEIQSERELIQYAQKINQQRQMNQVRQTNQQM